MRNQNRHPLEWKYIVYNYGVQDYADEGWALALYRLRNGKMEEIFHPEYALSLFDERSSIGEEQNRMLVGLMKKKGIRKVYSVFHGEDFFGVPAGWVSDEEGDSKEEVELWHEYKAIHEESGEYEFLRANGIEVEFYDEKSSREK